MFQYFIVYKPYQVLSQFSPADDKKTLKDFFKVPSDVYPIGRLDFDSEGLLLLSNDPSLNHRILNPAFKHEREYWVQVDGMITNEALQLLANGVQIKVEGKSYYTAKCKTSLFISEPDVPVRTPSIRFRKEIPAPWISLILTEGKNRQVRKMTAAVGFPTLRLIRQRIENITIDNMHPGEMLELSRSLIFKKLFHE